MPAATRRSLPVLWILLCLLSPGCSASEAEQAAEEGARLYDRGDYDAALPLLEKAAEQGVKDGEMYYQLAYLYNLKNQPDKARAYRDKAAPLLAKQADSKKGTMKDSYYLTALYASLQRPSEVKQAAEQGIRKFAARTDLSGDDLFRLGRLYQFAGNGSAAAATYRKAVETMGRESGANPVLHALALNADAGTDLQSRRYAEAGEKLEKAASLNPKSAAPDYQRAIAQLGAGNYAVARERFALVRDESSVSEAQYGGDVARHLEAPGGRLEAMPDGRPFLEMDNAAVEAALAEAASAYREAKGADPVDAEKVRQREQLFFSLAAEWMLRGNSLRETALSGNYADLIRR